jgi:hypothetical protein
MNPGFWHSNFYPTDFWHENFWPDFGGLTTTAVHIFSTSNITPDHISDSGNNVLMAGDLEVQGSTWSTHVNLPNNGQLVMGDLENESFIGWINSSNQLNIGSIGDVEIAPDENILLHPVLTTQIGGAANYLNVDSDGLLTFIGTSAINGLFIQTTRVTSGPYIPLRTDDDIFVDTDGGAITVNLPAGIDGKKYTIKNVGTAGNIVTLHPNGGDLLFGLNEDYIILDRGDDEQITFETTEGWG